MAEKKQGDLLDKLRLEINSIDEKLVEYLDERAKFVKQIGDYKKEKGIPIYQPGREKEVKERILKISKSIFPPEALVHIYTEIVSAARAMEKPLQVGYLGPEATFSEFATMKHFGSSIERIPLANVSDVFRQVENGKLDYGVVPIENTLQGTVYSTLDEFIESNLHIVAETFLPIRQQLLANVEDVSQIKRVYSHPAVFPQCRIWLESNLPNVEKVETTSTAKAASMVPWDKFSAAIGTELAAETYGLNILARNIEDNPENYTRFWVLSRDKEISSPEKTTILVSIKDKPGALLKLLSPFQVYNINLSKIESRPSRRKSWDYLFFIDLIGSIEDNLVKKAIDKVREDSAFVKVLGSYPRAELSFELDEE